MCQALREWLEDERAEGRNEGRYEGEELFATLMSKLFSDNRMEDAKLAANDKNIRRELYKEYGMKEELVQL